MDKYSIGLLAASLAVFAFGLGYQYGIDSDKSPSFLEGTSYEFRRLYWEDFVKKKLDTLSNEVEIKVKKRKFPCPRPQKSK